MDFHKSDDWGHDFDDFESDFWEDHYAGPGEEYDALCEGLNRNNSYEKLSDKYDFIKEEPQYNDYYRQVEKICSEIGIRNPITMDERQINGIHEKICINGKPINNPINIGGMMGLYRKFNHPNIQTFLNMYFESGLEYQNLLNQYKSDQKSSIDGKSYGRTKRYLTDLLLAFFSKYQNINAESKYSFYEISKWLLNLFFIRTTIAGKCELKIFEIIGGPTSGWRFSELNEDLRGADLINDINKTMIQIKSVHSENISNDKMMNWYKKWKKRTNGWYRNRYLIFLKLIKESLTIEVINMFFDSKDDDNLVESKIVVGNRYKINNL